jgi:hypothetical protein
MIDGKFKEIIKRTGWFSVPILKGEKRYLKHLTLNN